MGFTCGILTSCFHVNPKVYLIQIPSGEKSTILRFENLVVTRTKGYLHSRKAHITRQARKSEQSLNLKKHAYRNKTGEHDKGLVPTLH